jgi:circadian clock protein KaiC
LTGLSKLAPFDVAEDEPRHAESEISAMNQLTAKAADAATGVVGLDDILGGGLARNRVFLLEGSPGTGKTTLALSFTRAGAALGERTLYVTLSETEEELRDSAASHGWDLAGVEIFELVPPENLLDEAQQQSLLYSSDLELGETTQMILEAVERVKPQRIVIDSLSEIRLLAMSSLRYRRQVLALKHYFSQHGATVILLDDLTGEAADRTVHSVAHGVIKLEELAPEYGAERRRARVVKYRGRPYRGGFHDFTIRRGGIEVFPRLISAEHRTDFDRSQLSSGIEGLDALLGGGLERGTSCLILGPAGAGKSLLSVYFAAAAIRRGEKAALFIFDEEKGLLVDRVKALGLDLAALTESGSLLVEQVDAAELSPGEFTAKVRDRVACTGARTVVIDSLNGYQASMPEEHFLLLHMHELLQFLNRQGATTFLTVAQHGLVGDMRAPVDVTYLADTVLLLRYFEAFGQMRRAMSVVKKRAGAHERSIREYEIRGAGLTVGPPLEQFQGVMRGAPEFVGTASGLMTKDAE